MRWQDKYPRGSSVEVYVILPDGGVWWPATVDGREGAAGQYLTVLVRPLTGVVRFDTGEQVKPYRDRVYRAQDVRRPT